MTKPRIALLHYAAPPILGGVEATLAAQARLFARHGYAVQVIAGRGESFDSGITLRIVPEVDSQQPRILRVNAQLAQGIATDEFRLMVNELARKLQAHLVAHDLLIAHNVLSLHKNLALTAALKQLAEMHNISLIAWCHDLAWTDPQYASELHQGFPWDLLRVPWAGVKYVAVSQARKEELQALWGAARRGIAVIPPGIDPGEFFGVTEKTARWARELALWDAAPLLLLPARITRRKNIERAIEITAALRARGANAKLLVTGSPGPHNPTNSAYLEELRGLRKARRIEDAVIFLQDLGQVDDATRRDLYLLADGLLFTSAREGFGIPLLEAALARLPVFCTDLPMFHEIAGNRATYIARDEASETTATRIIEGLADDAAYQFKRRVVEEYGWERIFREDIEPLLQTVRGGIQ